MGRVAAPLLGWPGRRVRRVSLIALALLLDFLTADVLFRSFQN